MALEDLQDWNIDLTKDLDMQDLRGKTWEFQEVLADHFGQDVFRSLEGLAQIFDSSEGGLTLRGYDHTFQYRRATDDVMTFSDYESIRNLCTGFNKEVLTKMKDAGDLVGAYLLYGFHTPQQASFFTPETDFFLRPVNAMNFLCGKNKDGGPVEFYFNYKLNKHPFKKEVKLVYAPDMCLVRVEHL